MEAKDTVTNIIKEMGLKPNTLLNNCIVDVSNMRNNVIKSQRIITLAPLALSNSFKQEMSEFPETYESYVFTPKELPSFLGFAQMTQNTGFLICFINEHPEELAQAVLMKLKSKNFVYLVSCAIPAAFGYFSSNEHLKIAIKFYHEIVEKCDQKKAIMILKPLLHSAATFRFIESAFSKFAFALSVDAKTKNDENSELTKLYSNFLVECICQSLPLIPEEILGLLRHLKNLDWDRFNFGNLFFQKFLWKYAVEWISHSPAKKYLEIFKKIIENVTKDDNRISEIYHVLFSCKSSYQLPSLYKPFGHMYLDFYLSVYDIHLIAKLLNSCKKMPETVTLNELQRVPEEFEYYWYYCQVYPHIPSSVEEFKDQQIFPGNSKEIKILEKLLCYTLFKNELIRWNDLINVCLSVIVDPFIIEASKKATNIHHNGFKKILRSLEKSFNIPYINRMLYLSLIEINLETWIDDSSRHVLDHLDQQFNSLLQAIHKKKGMMEFTDLTSSLHKSLKLMLDTIRKMACIENSSLYNQFNILVRSMYEISFIQKYENLSDTIYPTIIQQCNGKNFLSTFIKLNSFAMRNRYFLNYCSDNEKLLWLKIESVILFCLKLDPVFLQGYITLQDQFIGIAEKNMQISCY